MGRKMRIAPPVLFVIALCLMAVEAHALFGGSSRRCDPTDNDIAAANMVIAEVEEMERAVIEALRLQTGQLAGYEAQSASVVTQALDSQTRLLAQVLREVEESETVRAFQPTSSACRTATGATGLPAAREGADAMRAAAEALETGRLSHDLAHVAPGGAMADSEARFQVLTETFCAAGRAGQEGCSGEDARHGADLMPSSLFGPATLVSPEERQAALEFARNLAAPVVAEPIPYDAATTPAERRRVLVARAQHARAALSLDALSRARAMRTPAVALGAWAGAITPGERASGDAALSRHELLSILASRRLEDPAFYVALESMSTEPLLRELVRLTAISLVLDWERYLLAERQGAVAATGLSLALEEAGAGAGALGAN
ncbi:MAG: hypothetical protein OXK73_03455 [Rhodospirillaceae bacterium]|nr:hypothetical protein [Rhodospirillaceae bacterium]MDE0417614.1 hypothetical protein [bacterium]